MQGGNAETQGYDRDDQISEKALKNETLVRILDAAETEFFRRGLGSTTINAIAAKARVSRQIIYRYYETKEQLFAEVIDRLNVGHERIVLAEAYDTMTPTQAIRTFIGHNFDICFEHRAVIGIELWRENIVTRSSRLLALEANRCLSEILSRGQERGIFRPDIEPARVFCFIMALAEGIVSSANVTSRLFDRDFQSTAAMARWRDFCADAGVRLVLKAPQSQMPG